MTKTGRREISASRTRRAMAAGVAVLLALGVAGSPAARAQDIAPYDVQMMRLAEILGALHHLRPLCGADEGQVWRDEMTALITAEQPSTERKRRLTERFNSSYQGLAATHRVCSDAARALIERYTAEGAALAQEVVTRWGRS